MALTRKFLKDLGIEGEEVDKIISEHRGTVDSLKDDIDSLKSEIENHKAVEKELNDLKESIKDTESYKDKYDALDKKFTEYKAEVQSEKVSFQKAEAYKAMLKNAGVSEKRIESVLKLARVEGYLDKIEFDKDGTVKNAADIEAEAKTVYADYVDTIGESGVNTPKPPTNTGNSFESMTLTEKMAYANANPDSAEVQNWMKG